MKKYEFNKTKFARKLRIDPRNCSKPNSCFNSISFDSLKYVLTYLVCVVSLVLHSKMTHTHAFMHINLVRVVDFIDQVHKNVDFTFGRPKIGKFDLVVLLSRRKKFHF